MTTSHLTDGVPAPISDLQAENAELRDRLHRAERYTAETLLRATRLAQVISVLAHDTELDVIVARAATELGELFGADVALLMLGPDRALRVAGHFGVRAADLPEGAFALTGEESGPAAVRTGPVDEVAAPGWLARYRARHVAWARLVVGDESLGHLVLVRRGDDPFLGSDAHELRAIAYRIAMAVENGMLHRRMSEQVARLHRLQDLTTDLAGAIQLDEVGRTVSAVLVAEVPVAAAELCVVRGGHLTALSSAGDAGEDPVWTHHVLAAADTAVGDIAIAGAPAPGTEAHGIMLHILGLAALALNKALLLAQISEQARNDSLTGLLGHRVFQEELERSVAGGDPFSVLLVDIDDFKQVNDLHGHQAGDDALRAVAEVLRGAIRADDDVFRVGGEEFCVLLPGLVHADALEVAERVRHQVSLMQDPLPLTVSLGLACFPDHGTGRDGLLAFADAGLYASKHGGKNRTSVGGSALARANAADERSSHLRLLQDKEPEAVVTAAHAAILAVEVARRLGLADDRLGDLRTAARLKDVGKVAVPTAVLRKPGGLDARDRALVQLHPTVGAELLHTWNLHRAARFVLEQAEQPDGRGYPAGLSGEQIAMESHIIRGVAAWVAMLADRPWRPALTPQDAARELVAGAGTRYHADVVRALLDVERAG